ncbi:MAG: autotransporter-associated beta strand repeat-containing protein [Bacteroidales bacterium]|nr:autotransporter-associated beta strand repeat-containing protein [Candidatus Liminaster caballi]
MNRHIITFMYAGALSLFAGNAPAQQLAFPGAQGWGRFALGARGQASPSVYHVTNLNDSGSGSLRDAVSQRGRIVVFDVSGVIRINSRIIFASDIYVAGQTAPGEGITVYGDGVSFSGASNIICRYLRVRMGHGGSSGKDCAGIANGTNMIFDHCSFSWGLDETFSINPDGHGDMRNVTIQNTIVGQGLMTHSAGGLMQADSITLYRNLYCDNSTRNNKVKGINQFANNVIYNWKNGAYIMGGDSEGKSFVNIESNLFINGPAGGGDAFTGANADFHCYGVDNWQDNNVNGIYDPFEVTRYSASTREPSRYPYPDLELWSGRQLNELLLPDVGASLPYRDQADCYMVDEVLSYGAEGALITYESSLPIGTPDTWAWWQGNAVTDTDRDGMPDWWEEANGTNPSSNDACTRAANGYLNIENYINSITVDDRQFFLRRPINVALASASTSTLTIGWRDYTYAEDGFAVELLADGSWHEMARTAANVRQCVVSGLEPGTTYSVRVRAFANVDGSEKYSEYSAPCSCLTRPLEVGMVDIDTYEPDVTNSAEVTDGQKVLYHAPTGDTLAIALTSDISPASIVATGAGTVALSGSAIKGDGTSVNRDHEGILVLDNRNSYTGTTVTHGGTIMFSSIANGGTASAIGASQPFAQNWIFDGGTFCYTGSSASSNRSARIDRNSTLAISKSSATLTMSGVFEGDGGLTIDGPGTVSIANISFIGYNGPTRLKGGKLLLSDIENACKPLGSSGRQIVMAGGTLQFVSRNEDYQELSFPIHVEDETHSTIVMPTHCYFKPAITGNGTLQLDIPYLRSYLRPDLSQFTGKIIGRGTNSSGASLFFSETQWNAPGVRFELKGNAHMAAWTTNAVNVIGGLSGDAGTFLVGSSKQSDGWRCSWEVGSANSDETFRGVINNLPAGLNAGHSGTVSIKKVGSGVWRLTGANVYSGTTSVADGTLVINGTHTGSGAISVSSGATLRGIGSVAGRVRVETGGIITSGDTLINYAMFKLEGGLAMQGGSRLSIPVSGTKTNSLRVSGSVSIAAGSILAIDLSADPYHVFNAGDKIRIFFSPTNITSHSGEFADIEPASPGDGLKWDTSTIFTDGYLRVAEDATGIESLTYGNAANPAQTFNLDGLPVSDSAQRPGTIYIIDGRKVLK